ncbi:MAG: HD domain-containing protein [Nanoarchaeota archaeon]
MDEIERIYHLYTLKHVARVTRVRDRFETTAEHVYSCMILARYFLPKIPQKLDALKVMNLILYHDIVEIECGDTFVLDGKKPHDKKAQEEAAFEALKKKIPSSLASEYHDHWIEYEEGKTMEAKFAQAIDKLDPIIHQMHMKQEWRRYGFTEEKLRESKERYFEPFPAMKSVFEKLLSHGRENGYFK